MEESRYSEKLYRLYFFGAVIIPLFGLFAHITKVRFFELLLGTICIAKRNNLLYSEN